VTPFPSLSDIIAVRWLFEELVVVFLVRGSVDSFNEGVSELVIAKVCVDLRHVDKLVRNPTKDMLAFDSTGKYFEVGKVVVCGYSG